MVSGGGSYWHDAGREIAVRATVYILLFASVIFLSKYRHDHPRISSLVPDAGIALLVGIVAGRLIYLFTRDDEQFVFSPTIFLYLLLPPILFNQAYNVHRFMFSRYLLPISMYAFIGTVLGAVSLAGIVFLVTSATGNLAHSFLELLAFASLLSATAAGPILTIFARHKVDPQLFHLVAGESVMNNLVAIVLFEAFANVSDLSIKQYLSTPDQIAQIAFDVLVSGLFGPFALALLWCFGVLFLLKRIRLREESQRWELAVYLPLILYAPFMIAECAHLNGLATVIIFGLVLRRYDLLNNVTEKKMAENLIRRVAQYAETVTYLEMGITAFRYWKSFNIWFVLVTLAAIVVGRIICVMPTTMCYNLFVEEDKHAMELERVDSMMDQVFQDDTLVPFKTACIMCFANVKGVLVYGLVRIFPSNIYNNNQNVYILTTTIMVIVTTFFYAGGGFAERLLALLRIPCCVDEALYIEHIKQRQQQDGKALKVTGIHGWRRLEQLFIIKRLKESTERTLGTIYDVTDEGEVQAARRGKLDAVAMYHEQANFASSSVDDFYVEYGSDEWEQVMQTNISDDTYAHGEEVRTSRLYEFGQ
mmetsp:Transcript_17138/g.25980  ORF Transcript_17138/g.25980 Transcript_17138/m.25980 type:complete len:590 (-) Transcript_17138:41-1810(-)